MESKAFLMPWIPQAADEIITLSAECLVVTNKEIFPLFVT